MKPDNDGMNVLDNQMAQWSAKLCSDVKIQPEFTNQLATTIASEVSGFSTESKQHIIASSPISFDTRLVELTAFQGWMDYANQSKSNPYITRAQIITEIYVCFVYLGESWFKILLQEAPSNSITRKCCKFLTDNPVRAFRNAIAHANWQYKTDFSGLEFWARKGQDENEPLSQFTVSQQDLNFWQMLARCVAYASFLSLSKDDA